jgi:MFS family permease
MVATATYAGLTLGPPLGGLLIAHAGWRWIFLPNFLPNVPVAVLTAVLGPWRWSAWS